MPPAIAAPITAPIPNDTKPVKEKIPPTASPTATPIPSAATAVIDK